MSLLRRLGRAILGSADMDECAVVEHLARRTPKTMVDVGAHVGGSLIPFARKGWDVHAFEPDPSNRTQLLQATREFPRVKVNPLAVTSVDGEKLPLFTSEVSTGISTLVPFHESHEVTAMVATTRLDTYLRHEDVREVGFLKVDAEGHDFTILQTFPWTAFKPSIVLCEFEDRKTIPLDHTYRDIADLLVSKGYAVVVSEWRPVVEYGQQHVWRRAASYPCEVPRDAWGNLLALPPDQLRRGMRLLRLAGWRLRVRRLFVATTTGLRKDPPC